MHHAPPRLRTALWRDLRRRCPQCGQGAIFQGWIKMHDHCGVCRLDYLPDQGDLWAYLVTVDRALFLFPIIVMIYFRLYIPDVIWFYSFTALVVFLFIFTLPHRNGMALGADYYLRRRMGDLAESDSSPPPSDRK